MSVSPKSHKLNIEAVLNVSTNEPIHERLILIAYASSKGSDEPVLCAVSQEPSLLKHRKKGHMILYNMSKFRSLEQLDFARAC